MKRKITIFFFTLLLLFIGVGCNQQKAKATLIATEENRIVLRIEQGGDNAVLLDALNGLQADGGMQFTFSGGMILSINGKENQTQSATSGYSWMIYTSNTNLSYAEYGSQTYGESVCYSAAFGAEGLKVQKGETIIISYDFWQV